MKNSALLAVIVWMSALAPSALAQTSADRRIDAIVLDSQGLPIVSAQVTALLPAGNLSRTVTSANERFTIECSRRASTPLRVSAPGFQRQDVSVDLTTQTSQTVEVRLRAAGPTEQVIVTATRSEQLIADVPASINVVTQRADRAVSRRRRGRRAAADTDVQPVSPHQQHRVASDRTGRVAARSGAERREPHARAARSGAVQRSIRRVGVLDARAADGHRAHRGRRRQYLESLRQLRDGRRDQHRHESCEPRTIIFKPQYGNRGTPKMDLFASDVWGKLGVTFNATGFDTDGYTIVAEEERGPIDIEANVEYRTANVKLDYNPTDRVNVFFRGGVFDEERENGKIDKRGERHQLEVRQRRRGVAAGGRQQHRRAAVFRRRRFFQSTFRGAGARRRRAAR